MVNGLTSVHTELHYDYYSLPFCRPSTVEHLGNALRGDRSETSPYEVMLLNRSPRHGGSASHWLPLERHAVSAQIATRVDDSCKGPVPQSRIDRGSGTGFC